MLDRLTRRRPREVADLVSLYVDHCHRVYDSREWMNHRSALAHLVLDCPTLAKRDVRAALAVLEQNDQLSPDYRRACWRRWLAFIR